VKCKSRRQFRLPAAFEFWQSIPHFDEGKNNEISSDRCSLLFRPFHRVRYHQREWSWKFDSCR